jgi:hypothetical protein
MTKSIPIAVVCLFLAAPLFAAAAQETSHLDFVREYVRELGSMEELRAAAETELKQKESNPLTNVIWYSTRVQLELRTSDAALSAMHLNSPFEGLPDSITAFHKQKIEILNQMAQVARVMMSGPKPGIDYGAIAAQMPQLRATLESVDETFIKLSALVFATLIDQSPDKAGHLSRLIITRAQRQELLRTLKADFGSKLDKNGQNSIVASAGVIRDYLEKKGFACSDEL